MVAVIASVGVTVFVPVGSTYANLMLLPQIPHAVEMGRTGEGGDVDPCMARSCFRGKRCRRDLSGVDHQLGGAG
jgi:hypothetical protein